MNVVIADAGPLIALSRINQLEILQQLFHKIILTEIIRDEILVNNHDTGKESIHHAIKSNWIKVKAVDMKGWKSINSDVFEGLTLLVFYHRNPTGNGDK